MFRNNSSKGFRLPFKSLQGHQYSSSKRVSHVKNNQFKEEIKITFLETEEKIKKLPIKILPVSHIKNKVSRIKSKKNEEYGEKIGLHINLKEIDFLFIFKNKIDNKVKCSLKFFNDKFQNENFKICIDNLTDDISRTKPYLFIDVRNFIYDKSKSNKSNKSKSNRFELKKTVEEFKNKFDEQYIFIFILPQYFDRYQSENEPNKIKIINRNFEYKIFYIPNSPFHPSQNLSIKDCPTSRLSNREVYNDESDDYFIVIFMILLNTLYKLFRAE
jgi:hypothetical protein